MICLLLIRNQGNSLLILTRTCVDGQQQALTAQAAHIMAQLFQRVAQYLADQVITPKLAQSKAFQRAAIKTHETVQKAQKEIVDAAAGKSNVGKSASSAASEAGEFFSTLRQEFSKDLKKPPR